MTKKSIPLAAIGMTAAVLVGCSAGAPATGINAFHPVVREQAELDGYTVYRPADGNDGQTFPVVVWANGGCAPNNVEAQPFLTNLAKHGFLIIAIGDADAAPEPFVLPDGFDEEAAPESGAESGTDEAPFRLPVADGSELLTAVDWITSGTEGQRAWGDPERIALMGQSCGGVQALDAASDPRVTSVAVWNGSSGLGTSDPDVLAALHGPTLFVTGGSDDIAHTAATTDYESTPGDVAAALAQQIHAGHMGLFGVQSPFGGALPGVTDPGRNMQVEAVELAVHWLDATVNDNPAAGKFFLEEDCSLCAEEGWLIESKNWGLD